MTKSDMTKYRLEQTEAAIQDIRKSIGVINDHSDEASKNYIRLSDKVDTMASEIGSVKGSLSRLNWIVIVAVAGAILNSVLR